MKTFWTGIACFCAALLLLVLISGARAQTGTGNGNGNVGPGSGNGNGNGNIAGNNFGGNSMRYRERRQAPAVAAPGLAAAGIETCLGSVSMGGSGAGFGFSFGTTKLDKGCNIRLYSRTLYAMGYRKAATQMLCYDAEVAGALATQGIRCRVGPLAPPPPVAYRIQQPGRRYASQAPAQARRPCTNYSIFQGCLD